MTEGVKGDFLQRELRSTSINTQCPDIEFWELWDRAIQWLGEDADSCTGACKKTTTVQQTKMERMESKAVAPNISSMTIVLDMLQKQQS